MKWCNNNRYIWITHISAQKNKSFILSCSSTTFYHLLNLFNLLKNFHSLKNYINDFFVVNTMIVMSTISVMDRLPYEILIEIFKYIRYPKTLLMTNKLWFNVAKDSCTKFK